MNHQLRNVVLEEDGSGWPREQTSMFFNKLIRSSHNETEAILLWPQRVEDDSLIEAIMMGLSERKRGGHMHM